MMLVVRKVKSCMNDVISFFYIIRLDIQEIHIMYTHLSL